MFRNYLVTALRNLVRHNRIYVFASANQNTEEVQQRRHR
jgi:hypothetical protein